MSGPSSRAVVSATATTSSGSIPVSVPSIAVMVESPAGSTSTFAAAIVSYPVDMPTRSASILASKAPGHCGTVEAVTDAEACPYCPPLELAQVVRFADDLVMYLDDERWQGALKHSGVIVPVRHAETVFDLTTEEVTATFMMLSTVKRWLDDQHAPDGYNERA